ncbi:MAG TPA: HAD family hydrolase [Miltoncostaea sp.]|nr:HAD family hydrolase [Miltoncostaea sp.]
MPASDRSPRAALVDIDGTLVDSNYQHAVAWFRAFRRHGVTCEVRVLHHLVGMGGDQLVTAAAGEDVERRHGDALREAEKAIFREVMDEVPPLPGARRLLETLAEHARAVVLSSSAKPDEAEHYVDLLDARDLVDGWTTSDDVDATKPAPDLIQAGLDLAGGGPALMIGDSTWDCRAAARAGVPTVAVLSGGYCREELLEAGAVVVFDTTGEAAEGIVERDLLA